MFNKGDLITATGLNAVNGQKNVVLPVLEEPWWPVIPNIQDNKVYLANEYYFHIATWYRGTAGDKTYIKYPIHGNGLYWYPNKETGIYLHGQSKVMFRYWYDPHAWTDGGNYGFFIERKENNQWVTVIHEEYSNHKGGNNYIFNVDKEGWYRAAISIESTYWSSDGSVGYNPAMTNCKKGDYLKCMDDPIKLGNASKSGTLLTANELNSGRIYTSAKI